MPDAKVTQDTVTCWVQATIPNENNRTPPCNNLMPSMKIGHELMQSSNTILINLLLMIEICDIYIYIYI